ncbi:MAG: hypothetical protein ACRD4Q_01205 [Candidatus Acidiferrales bacterium]
MIPLQNYIGILEDRIKAFDARIEEIEKSVAYIAQELAKMQPPADSAPTSQENK